MKATILHSPTDVALHQPVNPELDLGIYLSACSLYFYALGPTNQTNIDHIQGEEFDADSVHIHGLHDRHS
jgi:hypothetical protein